MKKRFLAILITIFFVGSLLTACAKEEKPADTNDTIQPTEAPAQEATKAPEQSSEPVTLTVW